jgi:energy-coupling factor transporter transmembrane protein EcfT
MRLELHANDNARTAQPSLWIFQGPAVGLLVVGVMFFVCLMLVLSRLGVDWISTIVISALPLAAITIFVHFFVNGRPPSYALDLLALQMWRLRCSWYLQRLLDKPPQLWVIRRAPRHPKEFS